MARVSRGSRLDLERTKFNNTIFKKFQKNNFKLKNNTFDEIKNVIILSIVLWCPIKVRVCHQNESCLSCPHPPLSYEGRREPKMAALILMTNSQFDRGHYGICQDEAREVKSCKCPLMMDKKGTK